jgi:riboflavin biosynthesis pyrimidine reductase
MDGIIIGINTLINDSPRLTGTLGETHGGSIVPVILNYAHSIGRADYVGEDYLAAHKQPTPVVLDTKLRFPLDASLLKNASTKQGKSPFIFTGVDQRDDKYSARWVSG